MTPSRRAFGIVGLMLATVGLPTTAVGQSGSFGEPSSLPISGYDRTPIAVGDLNGDQLPEIVVAPFGGGAVVLRGLSDGTFGEPTTLTWSGTAGAVALRDLNGDGALDVIAAMIYPSEVDILLGSGTGTFAAPVVYRYAATDNPDTAASAILSLALGDLDRNGSLDVVVARTNLSSNELDNVSVLLGNAAGVLALPTQFAAARGIVSIAIGHLTSADWLDLAVASIYDGVFVFKGTAGGSFATATTVTSGQAWSVAIGDWNRDGKGDLAAISNPFIGAWLGDGAGAFQLIAAHQTTVFGTVLAVGDINRDGNLDLVIGGGTAPNSVQSLAVSWGAATGEFQSPVLVNASGGISSLALADIDRDTFLDVIFGGINSLSSGTVRYVPAQEDIARLEEERRRHEEELEAERRRQQQEFLFWHTASDANVEAVRQLVETRASEETVQQILNAVSHFPVSNLDVPLSQLHQSVLSRASGESVGAVQAILDLRLDAAVSSRASQADVANAVSALQSRLTDLEHQLDEIATMIQNLPHKKAKKPKP